MTEAEWLACLDPQTMLLFRFDIASSRKLRLYAVACCRRIQLPPVLCDRRNTETRLAVAEQYADGLASPQELRKVQVFALCGGGISFEDFGHQAAVDAAQFAAGWSQAVCSAAVMLGFTKPLPLQPGFFGRLRRLFASPPRTTQRFETPPEYYAELATQCDLFRDIFGNPFRPPNFDSAWRTDTAIALARTMYESREFSAMPILADALQDAGCDNPDMLNHCRDASATHVRGCWVVDLVLGKE